MVDKLPIGVNKKLDKLGQSLFIVLQRKTKKKTVKHSLNVTHHKQPCNLRNPLFKCHKISEKTLKAWSLPYVRFELVSCDCLSVFLVLLTNTQLSGQQPALCWRETGWSPAEQKPTWSGFELTAPTQASEAYDKLCDLLWIYRGTPEIQLTLPKTETDTFSQCTDISKTKD